MEDASDSDSSSLSWDEGVASPESTPVRTDLWSEWDFEEDPPKPKSKFTFLQIGRFYKRGQRELSKMASGELKLKFNPVEVEYPIFTDRIYIKYALQGYLLERDLIGYLTLSEPKDLDIPFLRRVRYLFSPLRGYLHKRGQDGFSFKPGSLGSKSLERYRFLRNLLCSSLRKSKTSNCCSKL